MRAAVSDQIAERRARAKRGASAGSAASSQGALESSDERPRAASASSDERPRATSAEPSSQRSGGPPQGGSAAGSAAPLSQPVAGLVVGQQYTFRILTLYGSAAARRSARGPGVVPGLHPNIGWRGEKVYVLLAAEPGSWIFKWRGISRATPVEVDEAIEAGA